MNFKFNNVRITGILSIIPENESLFDDEIGNYEFPKETSIKLKETMGYNKHRIAEEGSTITQYTCYGFHSLFSGNYLKPEEIDALLVVGSMMDYIIPPTSNVIQGKLGLKEDCYCLDISQACAGFEIGLIQAFQLLQQESVQKVALVNADLLGLKVSKRDRNSYPLIGDGTAITIIEKSEDYNPVYANVKMDGKGAFAIHIPAGGLAKPSTEATGVEHPDQYGNWRSEEQMVMKGDEVFMFVQKRVPPMINALIDFAGTTKDDVDFFMFHQPNRFMLQKIARKLKIDEDRMPMNIVENFGNSSGVTVPLNICYNLGEKILKNSYKLCMAGFGGGLVWSSILTNVGPLDFCKIIEFPKLVNS